MDDTAARPAASPAATSGNPAAADPAAAPVSPGRRAALRQLAAAGLGLAGLGVAPGLPLPGSGSARAQTPMDPGMIDVAAMKPGEFAWFPDRAPAGFVGIIVSLPDQRCYVYRNGIRIGVSTVSTGRPGFATPTGVFTILQKDVVHHSSEYDDASMPYTERLTWSGVALHAGGLPGYPSSHGCVHLPLAFAKLVFGVTHYGTPVIVADSHSQPLDVLHPGLVLPADAMAVMETEEARSSAAPGNSPAGQGAGADGSAPDAGPQPVAVVVSGADKALIVMKGAEIAFQSPVIIKDPGTPLGNVVYVLKETKGDVVWTAFSYEGSGAGQGKASDAIARISVEPAANQTLAKLLVPGSTMLITDLSAHSGTRSAQDFVIVDAATS